MPAPPSSDESNDASPDETALPASAPVREAAELEYAALLGERAHYDAAYWAFQRFKALGLTAALLGALTTGSALKGVGAFTELTGILALLLTITTVALNFLDPKTERDRHEAAAKKLAALRADVRLARRTDLEAAPDAIDRVASFLARHAAIVGEAPALNSRRRKAALEQLEGDVHYIELKRVTGR